MDETIRTEAVSTIKSSVGRIENVVSQLEQIASLRPVDPGTMTVQPVADLLRRAAERTPALTEDMLDVSGAEGVVVRCAASHVVQALQELFSNAVRHGAPPVQIAVTRSAYVDIEVRGHGQGIPPEWEKAVFLPFLNAVEGYLAPSPDSLGLGLTLARALLVATGGDLHYLDEAFSIRLPPTSTPRLDTAPDGSR